MGDSYRDHIRRRKGPARGDSTPRREEARSRAIREQNRKKAAASAKAGQMRLFK